MKWPRKTPQLTVKDTFFGRYDCFDWPEEFTSYRSKPNVYKNSISQICLFEDLPFFFQLFQILGWCAWHCGCSVCISALFSLSQPLSCYKEIHSQIIISTCIDVLLFEETSKETWNPRLKLNMQTLHSSKGGRSHTNSFQHLILFCWNSLDPHITHTYSFTPVWDQWVPL